MSNSLTEENAQMGFRDWQLTRVHLDKNGIRSPRIEGYCSHQSVEHGDILRIMVSTNPPVPFEIEIFRMGYYGGCGARLMRKMEPFDGVTQPDATNSHQECAWETAAVLEIPPEWKSGVYLGRLTTLPTSAREPYWQSYIIFIVRDVRPADIIFQCSDNTWQAYNQWPAFSSLYVTPEDKIVMRHRMNASVSFDRPYGKYPQIFDAPQSVGSGEFLLWEFPSVFWLEQQGYDVTYISNADVLQDNQLTRSKVLLSVGHDEYWDLRQYYAVQNAIENGLSILWLSANSVYGIGSLTSSSAGQKNRILTRTGIYGGMPEAELAEDRDSFPDIYFRGPDERKIIGGCSPYPCNGGGDWICTNPNHWIFEGTEMEKGERIAGLVGWEFHGHPLNEPNVEIIAEGDAWQNGENISHWASTVFYGPINNVIFNAATIFWTQGLSTPPGHILPWSHYNRPHGVDERVQKITKNVMEYALR